MAKYLKYFVAVLLAVLIMVLAATEVTIKAPANSVVYAREQSRTFLSPPCIKSQTYSNGIYDVDDAGDIILARMKRMTLQQAISQGFVPDPRCQNHGGFGEDMTQLEKQLVGHQFFYGPRWAPDGSWRW